MDFENAIKSLSAFLGKTDNAFCLAYAVVTAALTLLVCRLCRKKTQLPYKFDSAELLAFAFAVVCAVVNLFFVEKPQISVYKKIVKVLGDGAVIGAMATVLCQFVRSLSGKDVKKLLANDAFAVVYSQLLYCGGVKERLNKGELTLEQFAAQAKILAETLSALYGKNGDQTDRKKKLFDAVAEFMGSSDVSVLADALDSAFEKLFQK